MEFEVFPIEDKDHVDVFLLDGNKILDSCILKKQV